MKTSQPGGLTQLTATTEAAIEELHRVKNQALTPPTVTYHGVRPCRARFRSSCASFDFNASKTTDKLRSDSSASD